MGAAVTSSSPTRFSDEDKIKLTKSLQENLQLFQAEGKSETEIFDALSKLYFEKMTIPLKQEEEIILTYRELQPRKDRKLSVCFNSQSLPEITNHNRDNDTSSGIDNTTTIPSRNSNKGGGDHASSSSSSRSYKLSEKNMSRVRSRRSSAAFEKHLETFAVADFETDTGLQDHHDLHHSNKKIIKELSSNHNHNVNNNEVVLLTDQSEDIAKYLLQLKSGDIETKAVSDFRSRRLTYEQQTSHQPEPPMPERRKSTRLNIYSSSEMGVIATVQPPFAEEVVGTFSCHGIEPKSDNNVHEKINQDRGCVVYPFNTENKSAEESLFMVLDGHGEQGASVSEFAMRHLVLALDKHPSLTKDPRKALHEAVVATHEALFNTSINFMSSGSTCICCYIVNDKLYVANVGDSRAVMGVMSETGEVEAMDLSKDHKPDDEVEYNRVLSAGGYIKPGRAGQSARVYLDPALTMIGIATSRSIGDLAVKKVGVTAEPEIKEYTLTSNHKFMILASDGVWEFITSEEAVGIIDLFLDEGATAACQELIAAAMSKWEFLEGDYRDDITAIVVTFPLPIQSVSDK